MFKNTYSITQIIWPFLLLSFNVCGTWSSTPWVLVYRYLIIKMKLYWEQQISGGIRWYRVRRWGERTVGRWVYRWKQAHLRREGTPHTSVTDFQFTLFTVLYGLLYACAWETSLQATKILLHSNCTWLIIIKSSVNSVLHTCFCGNDRCLSKYNLITVYNERLLTVWFVTHQ